MKTIIKRILAFIVIPVGLLFNAGCDDQIESRLFDEYSIEGSPSSGLMQSILYGMYADFNFNGGNGTWRTYIAETSGGDLWNERGGVSNSTTFFINFSWDAQNPAWIRNVLWTKPYQAIRDANFLIEAAELSQLSDEDKAIYRAEGQFVRSTCYAMMYQWFGPVPLRTTTTDPNELGRPTQEEYLSFLENELEDAAEALPVTPVEAGRASRGAAYGILVKHYLNTKNWAKVIEYADNIDALGEYELFTDGDNPYRDLFSVAFEEIQREMLYAFPAITTPTGIGNFWPSHSYPSSSYNSFPDGSREQLSNQRISGTKNRVYDHFYDSFDPADLRRELILGDYIDDDGLLANEGTNRRSPFKYLNDPNADGPHNGNDFPLVRYADILLSKAEALNELNGPTQEAIDLINQIRNRAGIADLTLADATDRETLRDLILAERSWEFWAEGKKREDLIRHGRLLEMKRNHPVDPVPNAEDFRVLFPIPQVEIDANSAIEGQQNPGY